MELPFVEVRKAVEEQDKWESGTLILNMIRLRYLNDCMKF